MPVARRAGHAGSVIIIIVILFKGNLNKNLLAVPMDADQTQLNNFLRYLQKQVFEPLTRNVRTKPEETLSSKIKLNLVTWTLLQMYRRVLIFGKSAH